ncbi:MAG: hypothetical protein EA401_01425 [Planctomycetota bacterium]|nr:MAG: hypothetical protein EA401_01425 [Planctomycetota bacterium]
MKASLIMVPVALVMGALVGLGWHGLGGAAGASPSAAPAHTPSAALADAAPSQLQAVLHGPRHRVLDLHDYAGLASAAAFANGNDDAMDALRFPALVSADYLVESDGTPRRSHLQALVTRQDDGFVMTIQALDDRMLEPAQQRSWQPGQPSADALDRLIASVGRSLLALEGELSGGQRQAYRLADADNDHDTPADEAAAQAAASAGPVLLLAQSPAEGRYRVLSGDDLDEIQLHADGSLRWLRSHAGDAHAPGMHSALSLRPTTGPGQSQQFAQDKDTQENALNQPAADDHP